MGRAGGRLRRAEAGNGSQRRRTDRSLPAIPRQLQGAGGGRVLGRRAGEERHRQDPKASFAPTLLGSPRARGELMTSSLTQNRQPPQRLLSCLYRGGTISGGPRI